MNFGRDSEARCGQDFEAQVLWRGWCLVEILKMMLGRDSEDEIWSRFVFELVIRTQPSGPLCLWQCFDNPTQVLLPAGLPLHWASDSTTVPRRSCTSMQSNHKPPVRGALYSPGYKQTQAPLKWVKELPNTDIRMLRTFYFSIKWLACKLQFSTSPSWLFVTLTSSSENFSNFSYQWVR